MPALAAALSETGSSEAAEAIMTTDTVKKEFALTFRAGGKTCTLGGIAKGQRHDSAQHGNHALLPHHRRRRHSHPAA